MASLGASPARARAPRAIQICSSPAARFSSVAVVLRRLGVLVVRRTSSRNLARKRAAWQPACRSIWGSIQLNTWSKNRLQTAGEAPPPSQPVAEEQQPAAEVAAEAPTEPAAGAAGGPPEPAAEEPRRQRPN